VGEKGLFKDRFKTIHNDFSDYSKLASASNISVYLPKKFLRRRFMREVVQKIIATESDAKAVIDKAKAEADRILSDAQKKGHDIIERARQEAHIEAEKIVETVVAEAEQEKQYRLSLAIAAIENQIKLEPEFKQKAVEWVIRCVCKLP